LLRNETQIAGNSVHIRNNRRAARGGADAWGIFLANLEPIEREIEKYRKI